MKIKCTIGIAAGLLLSTASITAQVDSTSVYDMSLEELLNIQVVSASKKAESVADAPSNITVITAKMIKEWGCRDLKDVIRRVAGFSVIADRDEWVFPARGNVSDNNAKNLILIDGVKMNSIENFGPGNIIELPNNLSNVKQIEIIKGPGSALWGSDALTSVINIITFTGADLEKNTNAAVSYGQDQYATVDFQAGRVVNKDVDFVISGAYATQKGREIKQDASSGFALVDTASKLKPGPLGPYTTLIDKHLPGYMLQAKARIDKFSVNAMAFETGVYNRQFEYGKGRENYLLTSKNFIEFMYRDTAMSDIEYAIKVGTNYNSAEYAATQQGSLPNHQTNILWKDRGANVAIDANKPLLNNKLIISSGLNYIYTKCGPNTRVDNFDADSIKNIAKGYLFDKSLEDNQVGGYLLFNYSPIKLLKFVGGSRIDYNKNRGDDHFAYSPRAAIILYPYETGTVKLIYNRGYLRPTNFQTIGTVTSEVMDQAEFIYMQKAGNVLITADAFWQQLKGFILISSDQKNFANSGNYVSKGVELDINAPINNWLQCWANGTYIQPEGNNFSSTMVYDNRRVDLSGKLLSYPGYNANGGFTATFLKGKIFISPAIKYVAGVKYRALPATVVTNADKTTTVSDAESNYKTTSAFSYLDVNIGFEPTKNIGLYCYIDNILDVRSQTNQSIWNGTVGQYGRFVMGKIRIKF